MAQVFGYDVLIDTNLKPWLIEVNASPSMGVDSEVDVRVKGQMIADTVNLVSLGGLCVYPPAPSVLNDQH